MSGRRLAEKLDRHAALLVQSDRATIALEQEFAERTARVGREGFVVAVRIPDPHCPALEFEHDDPAVLARNTRVQPPELRKHLHDLSPQISIDVDEMDSGLENQQLGHLPEIRLPRQIRVRLPSIPHPRAAPDGVQRADHAFVDETPELSMPGLKSKVVVD